MWVLVVFKYFFMFSFCIRFLRSFWIDIALIFCVPFAYEHQNVEGRIQHMWEDFGFGSWHGYQLRKHSVDSGLISESHTFSDIYEIFWRNLKSGFPIQSTELTMFSNDNTSFREMWVFWVLRIKKNMCVLCLCKEFTHLKYNN